MAFVKVFGLFSFQFPASTQVILTWSLKHVLLNGDHLSPQTGGACEGWEWETSSRRAEQWNMTICGVKMHREGTRTENTEIWELIFWIRLAGYESAGGFYFHMGKTNSLPSSLLPTCFCFNSFFLTMSRYDLASFSPVSLKTFAEQWPNCCTWTSVCLSFISTLPEHDPHLFLISSTVRPNTTIGSPALLIPTCFHPNYNLIVADPICTC